MKLCCILFSIHNLKNMIYIVVCMNIGFPKEAFKVIVIWQMV